MNFDFQAVMVLALLVTGLIWALDAYALRPRRERAAAALTQSGGQDAGEEQLQRIRKEPLLVEYARSFFPIILVVLVLRSFLVEPFRIPSGSMMPTLLAGDFILVNKFSYGIRLPVVGAKIIDIGAPRHGDIVVFRFPKDPATDYIKRIVGLPGDRVRYSDKTVYINGERATQEYVGIYAGVGAGLGMSGASLRTEQLGEVKHEILVENTRRIAEGEFIVPENHYFVMGDNRDNSNDSRYWGTVPEENQVGKAFMIWMNWDSARGGITWNRIGDMLN
ncbi:MAG: signal peptidase I [Gammaproteobacteria bacterium]|nr:signal peptidase I [Gammaproteobacteria bacterium]